MWHWLAHHLGTDNGGGGYYLWWSGFGANFGEYVLLAGVIGIYRKHNCHVAKCWRLAKHPVPGTPYVVCKTHHPTVPDAPTVEDIHDAHRQANDG